MSCNLSVASSSVTELLKQNVAGDDVLYTTCYNNAFEGDKLSAKFNSWCNKRLGKTFDLNDKSQAKEIVENIRRFQNEESPDINFSTEYKDNENNAKRFGYVSIDDRLLGMRLAISMALRVQSDIMFNYNMEFSDFVKQFNEENGTKSNNKSMVADIITDQVSSYLTDRFMDLGKTEDEINRVLLENDIATMDSWLEGKNNIQAQNTLALYKEIISDRENYFKELFKSSSLAELRVDTNEDFGEKLPLDALDALNEDLNEEIDSDDVDETAKDDSIDQFNHHDGQFSTFMKHIDPSVKIYLSGLTRCNSGTTTSTTFDYDKNNSFGIPENMNINECCAVLYSSTDKTNLESMKNSITLIANSLPGFAAFHELVKYMNDNPDFAYKLYTVFGKGAISKMETVVDNNVGTSRRSNRQADTLTALRFEYLNALKSTSLINDSDISRNVTKEIQQAINDYKVEAEQYNKNIGKINSEADKKLLLDEKDKKEKQAIATIAKFLNRYYPTVEESTIAYYAKNAHDDNVIDNLNILYNNVVIPTIDGAIETANNYNNRQARIAEQSIKNKKIEKAKANKEYVDYSEFVDLSELYAEEYISNKAQKAAFELANNLKGFAPVSIELNSRNVEGNQSSDIINNSYITNLLKTIQSDLSLNHYGNYKFQSRQYDFSNILVEHKDENGNVVNYGLFSQNPDTKEFTPTPYAKELLRDSLFNGATNTDTNNSLLYNGMFSGDYTASAFINFFNTEDSYIDINGNKERIRFANYFMRTPSDAPKNFVITAPRYSVKESSRDANDGLFVIENTGEISSLVSKEINAIPRIGAENGELSKDVVLHRSLKQMISNITSNKIGNIVIPNEKIINNYDKKTGTATVTCRYTTKDGIENEYILSGNIIIDNGKKVLSAPKFEYLIGNSNSSDVLESLHNHYKNKLIKNGIIKRKVNTNHPVFKQFKNIFIQELTDAATALDVIFECGPDGRVLIDRVEDSDGKTIIKPRFKPGFGNDKESARKLYDNYHVKGTILDSNGNLTGNVFHSDKFSITKLDDNGIAVTTNYGEDKIIGKAFNFLYGGAKDNFIHFTHNQNGIAITLTTEQEQAINEGLSEFITDYCRISENRLSQYSNFIKDDNINDSDSVDEFILNYRLMYTSNNDLFEGDTKFYMSSQDFLKRAKEAQAAGIPYGIVNFFNEFNDNSISDIKDIDDSILSQTTFNHITANGTEKVSIKQRDKFVGVTVKNTIKTGDTIGVFKYVDENGNTVKRGHNAIPAFEKIGTLSQKLIEVYKASGLSEKAATAKAAAKMIGYANTKVNDAQSYITFEEWVRRVSARGQFNKYKRLIEAIYDESKPIDSETLNEFVQVQKNFYYDQHYNAQLQCVAPRQIKNAEFVLVPRFIKGTELEDVYNLMKKHQIDQLNTVETSKAGKANVLTLWDNDGVLKEKNIKDFENNVGAAREIYNYNYLYTQQETPQHLNAENKAGIQVLKKLFDNIPEDSPMYKVKEKFFKLYCANIHESFTDLMKELGIETDEHGNIRFNNDGQIEGLQFETLFDMFTREIENRGLDSNAMDYTTLADDSMLNGSVTGGHPITIMPTFMSNMSKTFENIAQSIFNNNITRQKLPGFHAVQVTNIGFTSNNKDLGYKLNSAGKGRNLKEEITVEEFNKLPLAKRVYYNKFKGNIGTSKELRYHPVVDGKTQSYIEIKLPKKNFGFNLKNEDKTLKTDEELLKELQDAKLDKIIGYRIPTEGKQSVAIMKVVGFIDDTCGSTIIVPDDWVSQTGADFDIDSVYGIQFNTFVDKQSKIRKYEYKESKDLTKFDWFRYINKSLKQKNNISVKDDITNALNNLEAESKKLFKELHDTEQDNYKNIPENVKNSIKYNDAEINAYIESNNLKAYDAYKYRLEENIKLLNNILTTYDKKSKEYTQINNLIQSYNNILDYITNSSTEYKSKVKDIFDKFINEREAKFNKLAKDAGLMNYEEFKNVSNETIVNSRFARNNDILQCMLNVLGDDSSLDENLARSNFDDLIENRDNAIDENIKKLRNGRSAFDFLDQALYQEDAMSGAKLKAASVVRDTMCSVCNTVHPYVSEDYQITVEYDANKYDIDELKKSFDNVKKVSDKIIITHNTFGWTKNNLNTAGSILTSYSSQTTAHILDAIKEGAIPNENDLTFPVFKSFPDLGIDYSIGVPFIMQPGITAIVNAYNQNKSIFVNSNRNPIYTAFRNIAKDLFELDGIDTGQTKSLDDIIKKLNTTYKNEFAELTGVNDFTVGFDINLIKKIPINQTLLNDRLKNNGIFDSSSLVGRRKQLVYDLMNILAYHRLNNFSTAVGSLARVCNPDKFGAKQSIFATNKVIDDIQNIVNNSNQIFEVRNVDGSSTTFLDAIYPDISKGIDEYMSSTNNNSKYPSLHYFLKYSTCPSIKINKMLFDTQDEGFVRNIKKIVNTFSNDPDGTKLTEKIYKDYENYVISHLYTKVDAIALPANLNNGKFTFDDVIWDGKKFVKKTTNELVDDSIIREHERRRIFGYGQSPDTKCLNSDDEYEEFTVEDINRPSTGELERYINLSPAQKVLWIQNNFDNTGIFKYLKVSLFNSAKYRKNKVGSQTISYIEDNDSIETVYNEFCKAYYNSNPLISLAALDLVKYSFVVEGYKMRKNAINKIISNKVLYKDNTDNSTGIVEQLRAGLKSIQFDDDTLTTRYVRAHINSMKQISSHRVEMNEKKQYEINRLKYGIIRMDATDKELLDKYNIGYSNEKRNTYNLNKFVKLTFANDTKLYKIDSSQIINGSIYLYPLAPLNETETTEWSVNYKNNAGYYDEAFYQEIIQNSSKNTSPIEYIKSLQFNEEQYAEHRAKRIQTVVPSYAKEFNINKPSGNERGGFDDVILKTTEHFENAQLKKDNLYIRSMALSKYIQGYGAINGSIQHIGNKDYLIKKVSVKQYNRHMNENIDESETFKYTDNNLKELIKDAQSKGIILDNVYEISPVTYSMSADNVSDVVEPNEHVAQSSVTELMSSGIRNMKNRQKSENDINATRGLNRLADKEIVNKKESIEANMDTVVPITAEYVQTTATKIINDLTYFATNDAGEYVSVDNPEVMNIIRNNPAERNRFLKTLLDARALCKNYRMINELDITSEDESLRSDLEKIRKAVHDLETNVVITKAEELFAKEYLANLSSNPNIQNHIVSILDGFHSAGAFDAWVNDLQETSSPLLQIITKEVMGDIRAKEMKAVKDISDFKKALKALRDEATKAGVTIDMSHVIDDYGKFIQDYNQAFVDKLKELRDIRDKFKRDTEFGEGSIEYLKAKFEYEKFLFNHTHQELKDDYYAEKLRLEDEMINKFPSVYSAYSKLTAKRREILSHTVNGELEARYQNELDDVNNAINNLTQVFVYDPVSGLYEEKPYVEELVNPTPEQIINTKESAKAISDFIHNMQALNKTYYTSDAKYGFEEELEKNLKIIEIAEERGADGKPTRNAVELANNTKYIKAKNWIRHNTRFIINPEIQEKLNAAYEVFKDKNTPLSVVRGIARKHKAYDDFGVVDAREFTEEELEKVRKEDLAKFNFKEGQPYSDRSLINNSPKNGDIFKSEFYKGMASNGTSNADYFKIVNEINQILIKYVDHTTGMVNTSEISYEDLDALNKRYDIIEFTKKYTNATNGEVVRKYIDENVDFITNEPEYIKQNTLAQQKGMRYYIAWQKCFQRIIERDGSDEVIGNPLMFGYVIPKGYKPDGSGDNSSVDTKRTEALKTIREYTVRRKTKYYLDKLNEMSKKSKKEYYDWYAKNHVYDPYTHSYQPISCWLTYDIKEHEKNGTYAPSFNQSERRAQNGKDVNGNPNGEEDMTNHNYKPHSSTVSNFRNTKPNIENVSLSSSIRHLKDDTDYSNRDIIINDYERKVKELFQSTMRKYVKTSRDNNYLDRGYFASKAKNPEVNSKYLAKEAAKFVGWINTASGRDAWYEDIDYATDRTINMPMLAMLKSKDTIEIDNPPIQKAGETPEEFAKRQEEYKKYKEEAEANNREVHKNLLDHNWEGVMEEFITRAAHFNAVQDNKYMLFYGKNMIDKLDVYVKNEGFNNLQIDGLNKSDTETRYVTKKDTRLQEQYVNWIRRLVYDQWKKPNNHLTRMANVLQSLTSSKFMMLNITGGIANVTVGQTQILGEVFAKEYFGAKAWAAGMGIWRNNVTNFCGDMYSEKATSLASAIVKFMNVVDFDENTGVVHIPDASTYIERARDIMYSPQASGEHFMQNSAMFSMMLTHRLYKNPNKNINGRLSWELMNEGECTRNAEIEALEEVMDDTLKDKWEEFKKYKLSDDNRKKEIAWYRQNLVTEFINQYFNNNQKLKFNEKRNKKVEKALEDFNNDELHPTLYSQLKLGDDGKLSFNEDSILFNIGDEAYELLGRFKGRVISVNKKIHGVYDRLGAAKLESYWWGGLVMQYHKHIYPGLMKRWRRQGYYNEERGTIEKGCYCALKDFLTLPLRKQSFIKELKEKNGMSEEDVTAVQGIQNIFKSYVEFATNIKLNWAILPEYEKANIRRNLGDLAGIFGAICCAIALRAGFGDDDDEGFVYNLFMYEADRLCSESAMYNPIGMASEANKLWSSPIAATSGIEDLMHTAGFIAQYIIQGDDFDPYYSSGLYAGENKVAVNLRRQIPIYHGISMLTRLKRSNKYYKLGDNMLSIIPTKEIGIGIHEAFK